MSSLRGVSIVVAGAGLAGLTAARDLSRRGARVSIFEARSRVGGRVWTKHEPFLRRQHAEAGADLIDESQKAICQLIGELGLRRTEILRGGFTAVRRTGTRTYVAGHKGWHDLAKRLQPEVNRFRLGEERWDGGIARDFGRQSVADWLDRIRAPKEIRDIAGGLRGFFLADPDELSLLALVEQFAEDGTPGEGRMFRIKGGNSRLPEALAKPFREELYTEAVVRAVHQHRGGVSIKVERHGRVDQIDADYFVCTLPATLLRGVRFDPGMPSEQRDAVEQLKYGAVTKTGLQFDRASWRKHGKPAGYGTNLPIGAVWDGNEEQTGSDGILSLMAGGRASAATQEILSSKGPDAIARELTWLDINKASLVAWDSVTWEREEWSRGGYAYIHHTYAPTLRAWLARPFGRVFFAGEHTSMKWQGYMNGAVETGRRAAEEVVAAEAAEGS